MNRSDRIYLSRFALDPDPEYLDLDDFDLDRGMSTDELDDEITVRGEKKSFNAVQAAPLR